MIDIKTKMVEVYAAYQEVLSQRGKPSLSQASSGLCEDEGILLEFSQFTKLGRRPTVWGSSSIKSTVHSLQGSGRTSRADTELEGDRKLTGKDKAMLGYVWTMALVYGMMSEQMLSKEVNRPCSVREQINSTISIASLMFGLVIPLTLGPIAVIIAHFILNILESCLETGPSPQPKKEDLPSPICILVLTIICLITYSMSMIIAEVFGQIYDNPFTFIMFKYVFGTFHHFLGPLSLLVLRRDLWELCKVVYRKGGTTQNKSVEMTYEEMQKQLGLGVDVN